MTDRALELLAVCLFALLFSALASAAYVLLRPEPVLAETPEQRQVREDQERCP